MDWWTFHGQRDKWMTLGVISIMLIMSTMDLLVDWANFANISGPSYEYTLVVGPPPPDSLTALLVFNLIGTLLYFLEFANMITILTNARRTKIPVEYEQGLVLLLEEIPLAITNLTIVTCRMHHVTNSQLFAGVVGILNVGVRLYAYGYFRECENAPMEKSTYKNTLKLAVYITVSILWLICIVTLGFMCKAPETTFHMDIKSVSLGLQDPRWLSGITLMLVHKPSLNVTEHFDSYDMTEVLKNQSVPLNHPWVVKDIGNLVNATKSGIRATYPCTKNATLLPDECKNAQELRFRFFYTSPKKAKPYGNIRYNVAKINGTKCTRALENIWEDSDWRLLFSRVRFELYQSSGQVILELHQSHPEGPDIHMEENLHVFVDNPWPGACTIPNPIYDKTIKVC